MNVINRLTSVILIGVCFTTALPMIAAIMLARRQAIEREEALVTGLARNALARTEMTADQLAAGSAIIRTVGEGQACSDAALDMMREIDLGSTLLQAVGRTDGDMMTCSSFSGRRPFDLGPPTLQSSTGALLRTDVRLIDADVSYFAFEAGSFVAIVHKDLPLSFVDEVPGLAVAVFNWSHRRLLIARGAVAPGWIRDVEGDAVFRSGGKLIAVVRSKRYDLGGVAALPLSQTTRFVREAALVLVPLGLIAGFLLSAAFIYVMRTRGSMTAAIRSGLRAGEFHLLYQPIIDLSTGRTVGVEALLRWRRDKGELIPPDTFIAAAESAGLMPLITERVLDLLAQDARAILAVARPFYFSVNFAAADVHRAGIAGDVQRFVARAGIESNNLIVEATERGLVEVGLALDTMRELRSTGVKLAIDDFGTGYSSLGYLGQLEVDYLKIDKLFVQALGTDSATNHVASRIIDMAKDLKLEIVAEGVETEAQERLLRELKVEFAQGFLFSPPVALDDLLQRLRAERRTSTASDVS